MYKSVCNLFLWACGPISKLKAFIIGPSSLDFRIHQSPANAMLWSRFVFISRPIQQSRFSLVRLRVKYKVKPIRRAKMACYRQKWNLNGNKHNKFPLISLTYSLNSFIQLLLHQSVSQLIISWLICIFILAYRWLGDKNPERWLHIITVLAVM